MPTCKRTSSRFNSDIKRSLFTPKRPADVDDSCFDTLQPCKRGRYSEAKVCIDENSITFLNNRQ